MSTPNTFPAPTGPTVAFHEVEPGTTANFTWGEKGRYTITLEAASPNGVVSNVGTVLLQQVVAGVTSTLLTINQQGKYDVVLPLGGGTLNFNLTKQVKNLRMTKVG